MISFWLCSHVSVFPADAVSLHSEEKTFGYCIPLNKCLLKLSLTSSAEVPSWRESPGSDDGFMVLLCGRSKAQRGSQSPFLCSSAFGLWAPACSTRPEENICSAGCRAGTYASASLCHIPQLSGEESCLILTSFLHPAFTAALVGHGSGFAGAKVSLCLLVFRIWPLSAQGNAEIWQLCAQGLAHAKHQSSGARSHTRCSVQASVVGILANASRSDVVCNPGATVSLLMWFHHRSHLSR